MSYGALQGMSTLREVTLPSSLYMVGEKAFYGCAGLKHIYNHGASPAACFDNTFTGVRTATCVLHVPYNTAEKDRDLLAVFTPIPDENSVTVTPSSHQVYFTWELEEGVDLYTLTVYADGTLLHQERVAEYTLQIDMRNYSDGVYLLRVDNRVIKVVKR